MLKRISLWDFFVSFGLGLFASISIIIHLIIINSNQILEAIESIANSTITLLFLVIPMIFVMGFITDAISNKLVKYTIEKIMGLRREEKDVIELANLVKEKYMPKDIKNNIIPYQWCKDYIIQKELETPFMAFLSKFGFYRGASCIFFLNGVFTLLFYTINYHLFLWPLFIGIMLLTMSYLLILRSRDFFQHTGRCVFRHFFIAMNYNKINKK